MAELALVANLVAVVGAGLQLSGGLYDFASTLGSAGREIEDMGYDTTLLCAVLKRVQSTLDNPRSARLSVTAIQTTQDIVKRCQTILDDIKGILSKPRKEGQSQPDVLARVKWTWKRPKVLMLRGSLQSCTTTLHLMLSAIDWARNATRRSLNGEPDQDHDQDREMTHSLFLAQQSANHRLEELEDQVMDDVTEENYITSADFSLPLPASSSSANVVIRPSGNRSPAINDAIIPDKSPKGTYFAGKRTSVLLNECLFEGEHSFESVRRRTRWPLDRRQSLMQSDELLRRWTERTEVVTNREHDPTQRSSEKQVQSDLNQVSDLFPGSPDPPPPLFVRALYKYDAANQEHLSFRQGDIIQVLTQLESGWWEGVINDVRGWFPSNYCVVVSGPDNPGELGSQSRDEIDRSADSGPSVEIFKSFRVGLDGPCYKVLPAALRKYKIQADWREYALYIVHGDQERPVGMEEKPLAIFRDLDRKGEKPMCMLRRITGGAVDAMSASTGLKLPGSGGGAGSGRRPLSSGPSVRGMGGQDVNLNLPGGLL